MGWNSWNCWGLSVDANKVKQAADFMVSSGLRDHGWTYINIDDGWETEKRIPSGEITGNEKFPDFKELSEYVHGKGLKLGIYSSPGPMTCGGYLARTNTRCRIGPLQMELII
jgi:alpha-galactosidase